MSLKLNQKQLQAIHMLAHGMKTIEIAAHLGLRRETLSRWKRIPHFKAEFERLMHTVREDMGHRLTHLVDASISTVHAELGRIEPDPKRIQTALNVLKLLGTPPVVTANSSKDES